MMCYLLIDVSAQTNDSCIQPVLQKLLNTKQVIIVIY